MYAEFLAFCEAQIPCSVGKYSLSRPRRYLPAYRDHPIDDVSYSVTECFSRTTEAIGWRIHISVYQHIDVNGISPVSMGCMVRRCRRAVESHCERAFSSPLMAKSMPRGSFSFFSATRSREFLVGGECDDSLFLGRINKTWYVINHVFVTMVTPSSAKTPKKTATTHHCPSLMMLDRLFFCVSLNPIVKST